MTFQTAPRRHRHARPRKEIHRKADGNRRVRFRILVTFSTIGISFSPFASPPWVRAGQRKTLEHVLNAGLAEPHQGDADENHRDADRYEKRVR